MLLTYKRVVAIVAILFVEGEANGALTVVPVGPSTASHVFLKVENCICNPKWRIYTKLMRKQPELK